MSIGISIPGEAERYLASQLNGTLPQPTRASRPESTFEAYEKKTNITNLAIAQVSAANILRESSSSGDLREREISLLERPLPPPLVIGGDDSDDSDSGPLRRQNADHNLLEQLQREGIADYQINEVPRLRCSIQ